MKHRQNFFFPFTSKFSNIAAKLFNFPVWSTQIERKIGPNIGIFHHQSPPWPRGRCGHTATCHVGRRNEWCITNKISHNYVSPVSGEMLPVWPEPGLISALLLLLVCGKPGPGRLLDTGSALRWRSRLTVVVALLLSLDHDIDSCY